MIKTQGLASGNWKIQFSYILLHFSRKMSWLLTPITEKRKQN